MKKNKDLENPTKRQKVKMTEPFFYLFLKVT